MSLVLNSAIQHQATTAHPDPVHLNLQFLRVISVSQVEIHIKNVRVGKQFTNLGVDVIQGVGVAVAASTRIKIANICIHKLI